jgi:uncharacterized protein
MWISSEKKKIQALRERAQHALTVPENVPSPCISVCVMDAKSGLCQGCWRTLSEIAAWSGSGDDNKRQVWQQILLRTQPNPKS